MEQYKYRCRGCRLQNQCIDASDTSLGAKEMIRNAFAARTDTTATWAVLQKNCLLLKADEELEQRAKERATALSRRLQEARTGPEQDEADEEASKASTPSKPSSKLVFSTMIGEVEDSSSSTPPPPPPSSIRRPADPTTASFRDELREAPKTQVLPTSSRTTTQPFATEPALACWLVVSSSQRRISLSLDGELTLGRFDPTLTTPLDVDLTWEDQATFTISRRHARIIGMNSRYFIRDLNSSNGVYINGSRVDVDHAYPLQAGNKIALGQLELVYTSVPPGFIDSFLERTARLRHYLILTHTGQKFELDPSNSALIGRTDPDNNIWATIDLGSEGDLATYVSRRHAGLTWNNSRPYLADLGSSYGTRLNGQALRPHQAMALNPGDHFSLGGCVLAYDVED